MKPYLVDVPVNVMIWVRPECQRKQFEILKQARPSILFLTSDGGRNEREKEIIARHRRMFDEEIDWECTVYRIYEEENQGLYVMGKKALDFIWSKVDRCVFLEDDYLPAVSYFRYCAELLERYKDDLRVNMICGMNYLGEYEDASADYFFTTGGAVWGLAYWKRTWELLGDYAFAKDPYTVSLMQKEHPEESKRWLGYAEDPLFEGHPAHVEYLMGFSGGTQHQLYIVPKKNQICNIGFGADAAHASDLKMLPRGLRQVFNLPTYEIEFPMKHPKYVIPDNIYAEKRNRIMAVGHPWVQRWRRMEALFLHLRYGDFRHILKRLREVLKKKMHYET